MHITQRLNEVSFFPIPYILQLPPPSTLSSISSNLSRRASNLSLCSGTVASPSKINPCIRLGRLNPCGFRWVKTIWKQEERFESLNSPDIKIYSWSTIDLLSYINDHIVDVRVADIRVRPSSIIQDLISQYVDWPDITEDTVMSLQQTLWGSPTNGNSTKVQI